MRIALDKYIMISYDVKFHSCQDFVNELADLSGTPRYRIQRDVCVEFSTDVTGVVIQNVVTGKCDIV